MNSILTAERSPGGSYRSLLVTALIVAVLLSGCRTNSSEFSCSMPDSFNVATAFEHTRSDLTHAECQFQYDDYITRLLEIAASDPKPANRKHFSDLFAWSRDQDIISQIQARDYYRRYFTTKFVSLDDRYSNCSATCRREDDVAKALKEELRDKDRGLLQALDDRDAFTSANRDYNQLLTLIEATCKACRDQ